MTTITTNNSSLVMNIDDLVNYVLNDLPELYEIDTKFTQKNTHKDHTYHLNQVQNLAEKACPKPSLHTLTVRRTKIQPYCKKSELKQRMKDDINRLRQKTKNSLERIQITYAN